MESWLPNFLVHLLAVAHSNGEDAGAQLPLEYGIPRRLCASSNLCNVLNETDRLLLGLALLGEVCAHQPGHLLLQSLLPLEHKILPSNLCHEDLITDKLHIDTYLLGLEARGRRRHL